METNGLLRRCGNNVAHGNKKLGRDEAMLCLENLFIFLDLYLHTAIQKILQNALLIKIRLLPEWKKPENQKWQQKI